MIAIGAFKNSANLRARRYTTMVRGNNNDVIALNAVFDGSNRQLMVHPSNDPLEYQMNP